MKKDSSTGTKGKGLEEGKGKLPAVPKRQRRQGATIQCGDGNIFQSLQEVNFDDIKATAELKSRIDHLQQRHTSTGSEGLYILHQMAKASESERGASWFEKSLSWLLKHYPAMLEKTDRSGKTPFHLALAERNDEFVEVVLTFETLKNLDKVLKQTTEVGNCLHLAIQNECPDAAMLIKKCESHSALFTEPNSSGSTPLHLAMEYPSEQHEIVQLLREKRFLPPKETPTAQTLEPGHGLARRGTGIMTPAQVHQTQPALPVTNDDQVSWNMQIQLTDIVSPLIAAHDDTLQLTNNNNLTPYQYREACLLNMPVVKESLKGVDPGMQERAFREIFVHDKLANAIREYCMLNGSREDIMKSLYKAGEERHIEFDLAGLPNLTITKLYLEGLANHIRFESILKYVALPKLTFEAPRRLLRTSRAAPSPRGRIDSTPIFEWLRQHGVQQILRVIVIDDEYPPHSDSSIEEALHGFGVQFWDWKKVDLCSDTICRSSSVVREVSLYCSGNNAVLKGWASPQGLVNEERFPRLNKVHLFMRWENETDTRLQSNLDAFKEAIEGPQPQKCPRITVQHYRDDKAVSYASGFSTMDGSVEKSHRWINIVQNFTEFLRNVPDVPPVKIAIIDDGVDASIPSLAQIIAGGKSFCRHPNSEDLMSAYYAPSGRHGTWIATLISKLCPRPSLYIARLEEHSNALSGGQRQITARSAAEAVRWAIDCNVEIISISWTIESSATESKEIDDLVREINRAHGANILIICSASDQGTASLDACYPGHTGNCIKVGAADSYGRALSWVQEKHVDFLFPGKNIPFQTQDGASVTYESGSSIATAAASGLAGLLLCWSRQIEVQTNPPFFRQRGNMMTAFRNMGRGSTMPDVASFLDTQFRQILVNKTAAVPRDRAAKFASTVVREADWDENSREALIELLERIKSKFT